MIAQGGRLPAEATRFFGRSVEAAAVKGALARSRLVTLTGPGGVGKTRLAVKVADELASAFADGVFLADLAPARDAADVLRAVAAAAGLPGPECTAATFPVDVPAPDGPGPDGPLSDRPISDGPVQGNPVDGPLPARLGGRRLLLILDTAEHVVDACAGVADALLSGGDGPVLLVTSRQPLDLPGEVVFRIPPLPAEDDVGDAVRLLADRAAAATGRFPVTEDMLPALVPLCRELDGLPLALELAAPRLRAVGLDELLARLPGQQRLLAGGRRAAAGGRQRSLEESAAWSYALCTPDEQRLWAGLSVFADGFDLAAAEAVCGSAPAPGEPPPSPRRRPASARSGNVAPRDVAPRYAPGRDMVPRDAVLGALVGLVDKSVVLRVADVGGAARYRLLAAAREYGAAQATGAAATAGRHRHHYLGRARAAADAFAGPAQLRLVDELGRDEANLRLAFDGALAAGDAATAGGLAVACWPWLVCTGRLAQARSWLARARADPPRRQRRTDHPERGRGSARPVPFPPAGWPSPDPAPGPADARVLLAWVLSAQGDPAAADALPEPGERDEGGRDAPAASGSPLAAGHLGAVAAALTDVLAALRLGALADCRRRGTVLADSLPDGERWARGWASWAGAVAAWCDGANPAAGPGLRAGLELLAPFGDEFAVAQHLEALGWLAARRGDGRRTARLQGAADRMWRDLVASGQVRAPRSGLLLLDVERDQAERHARDDLGEAGYAAEYATGAELRTAAAVSLALPGLASPYRAADAERAPRARPEAQQRALAALAAAPGHRTSRLREHAGGDAGARPAEGSAGAAEGSAGAAGGDCGAAGEDTADVGAAAAGRDLDARPAGVGRASGPGPGDVSAEAVSRAHWELLTAREREVAVLVAAGRTNRDIAARLVVSKRTVDAHVEHILGKLGYSSRVQVAALASAREQAGLARHGAAPGGRLPSGGPQPGGAASGGARPGGASPGRPR